MIRVINNTSIGGGEEEQQGLDDKNHKCAREEREAGAQGEREGEGGSTGRRPVVPRL